MTDDIASGATPAAAPGAGGPQIRVLGQYVKDISFESPGAPGSLRGGQPSPSIEVGLDVQGRPSQDAQTFELDLNIEARALREAQPVFLVELKYSGLFQLVNVPGDMLEPILMIECPRMLFPFARRIIADLTRDGGFPPLYIDPIDFAGLYASQKQRLAAQAGSA